MTDEPQIMVNNLTKTFHVPVRSEGLSAALSSLLKRHYREVHAVNNISFSILPGEVIGFIGPNGAGKTTTLKMLSGLLYPSSGSALVSGFIPWERKEAFLQGISMVLGNKSQMLWDIPPMDTFRVLGEIYRVPAEQFQKTLDELIALLSIEELLNKPVRSLSLGERMKCELVAGLLHLPKVIFLDEPTLGLDISMQVRLRQFIKTYNETHNATIILTSHYMADVVTLCKRVILIHHGKLLYDGGLDVLAERLAPYKIIHFSLSDHSSLQDDNLALPEHALILSQANGNFSIRVQRDQAPHITAHLLNTYKINDLSIENPAVESVIDRIYSEEAI